MNLVMNPCKESARRAKAWVASADGQAKLEQIVKMSEIAAAELAKKRKVDPKSLRIPCGPTS